MTFQKKIWLLIGGIKAGGKMACGEVGAAG